MVTMATKTTTTTTYSNTKQGTETKIDWKRKLTSRKLWLSVASFIAMVMIFAGSPENSANQVAAIVMAGATVIGYVVGEGLADYGFNGEVTYPDQEVTVEYDDNIEAYDKEA